jgi:hypothetical protein
MTVQAYIDEMSAGVEIKTILPFYALVLSTHKKQVDIHNGSVFSYFLFLKKKKRCIILEKTRSGSIQFMGVNFILQSANYD